MEVMKCSTKWTTMNSPIQLMNENLTNPLKPTCIAPHHILPKSTDINHKYLCFSFFRKIIEELEVVLHVVGQTNEDVSHSLHMSPGIRHVAG